MLTDRLPDFLLFRKKRVHNQTAVGVMVSSSASKATFQSEEDLPLVGDDTDSSIESPSQVDAYGEFIDTEEDAFAHGVEHCESDCTPGFASSSSAVPWDACRGSRRLASSSSSSYLSCSSPESGSGTTTSSRSVSGLPFVCNNCGVSYFTLRSVSEEEDCYCSGECKWSVILYREMDERMRQLRRQEEQVWRRTTGSCCSTTSWAEDEDLDEEDDDEQEADCVWTR